MITLRSAEIQKLLLTVNCVLFAFGFVHYTWSVRQSSEVIYQPQAGPAASRSLLSQPPPKPCECTYSLHDGRVERVDPPEVSPPPPPTPPVRNKIGQDVMPEKEFQVPNIVHYIWYNTAPRPLQFHHMLSIMSAHKMLQPDAIYFHTDIPPIGQYWERVKNLPRFKIVKRSPPTTLYGEAVKEPHFYTSHSNVDRVKILMEYGGIYLDFDTFVTRSMDDLRRHVCTIGYESDHQACGSVIVCSKHSFFLYLWINAYLDDYRMDEWAYNTGKVPFKLSKRFPHLVHVEETKLNRPNYAELDQIWGPNTWNWRENYAVHTWYRLWKDKSPYFQGVEPNFDNIKTWNSTFGEMARVILYGTPDMKDTDDD